MTDEGSAIFEDDVDLDALRRIDPRLVALALGRIDEDELDELMERAVKEPSIRRAVEAFWPLSDETRRSSFDRARSALTADVQIPRRPHWSLMFLPTGVAGAVVGLVAMTVTLWLQPPPLPTYDLEVRGGLRTMRSSRPDLIVGRLAPRAPLELVYRPAEPVEGDARAALFYFGSDGLVRLPVEPEVSDSGSVRWRGTISALLPGEVGAVELWVAVRSGTHHPTASDVQQTLQGKASSLLRVAKTTLVIEER